MPIFLLIDRDACSRYITLLKTKDFPLIKVSSGSGPLFVEAINQLIKSKLHKICKAKSLH